MQCGRGEGESGGVLCAGGGSASLLFTVGWSDLHHINMVPTVHTLLCIFP